MVLTKNEVLQIDATVIIGILVLLSVATVAGIGEIPERATVVDITNTTKGLIIETQPASETSEGLIPSYFYAPIYLVTFVISAFAISASIELAIILNYVRKNYSQLKEGDIHVQIPDTAPKNASPASIFLMIGGFLWLTITIILFALNEFFQLV